MINIFIGLSNNQVSSCESILKENKKERDKYVLVYNRTLFIQTGLWDEIVYAEEPFKNQPTGKLSSLLNIYFKIIHSNLF